MKDQKKYYKTTKITKKEVVKGKTKESIKEVKITSNRPIK